MNNAGSGGAANMGVAFNDNDSVAFDHAVVLTTDNAVTIAAIDLNKHASGPFTVAFATSLGSLMNTGGAQKLNTVVNGNFTLTLTDTAGLKQDWTAGTADSNSALGDITLNHNTANLIIDSNTILGGTIDGTTAGKGLLITIKL